MQQADPHNSDSFYIGSHTTTLHCKKVQPSILIFCSEIQEDNTLDATVSALKYRYQLRYLGDKYQKVVVPCIPAQQHKIVQITQTDNTCAFYIKCSQETETVVIPSGKRSAILKIKQNNAPIKILRLKGCGNQLKGFNREGKQSRGSHFFHTAKRELFMTRFLNQLFRNQLNIHPPANVPLYMHDYPQKNLQQNGIANDLPRINKFCCVFETQGDRRAGTHLISPLEVLYLTMVDHEAADWRTVFKNKGRIDDTSGEQIEFVNNFQLQVEEGRQFLETYQKSSEITNYIGLHETTLPLKLNQSQIRAAISKQYIRPPNQELFDAAINSIQHFLPALEAILQRIGWEMGQIKRVMCQHGVSWGFFSDHGSEYHCNAHLNNFIVTKPQKLTESSNYFLLPLDYDLAYKKTEFINIEISSPRYGHNDEHLFENYLCAEFNAMEMSLFGVEMMNFAYGITPQEKRSEFQQMGRIVFRDTLVRSFNKGMRNSSEFRARMVSNWNDNLEDITKIVNASLMMSLDFET